MESHIFESDGIFLEFNGDSVPTEEEWQMAKEQSKDYVPPKPPIYLWRRLEQALVGGFMRQEVVLHGNVVTLPVLYRLKNTLSTLSGMSPAPPDATAQETSETTLPTIPSDQL